MLLEVEYKGGEVLIWRRVDINTMSMIEIQNEVNMLRYKNVVGYWYEFEGEDFKEKFARMANKQHVLDIGKK